MDGDANDFKLLLASARHEAASLREDPRLGVPPGNRGAALREHVLDLLGAVEHRMSQEPPASAAQAARSAFARSMRQSIVMLRGAQAALPWLTATRSPTINMGSLYLTEECARILVGQEIDLVMVPNPEFMYTTTSEPFAEVINSTPGFVPTASRRPIVLNYPLTDGDRLLMHPIFAHEIGHASCDEYSLVDQVEKVFRDDATFTTAFEQAITTMASTWTASPPPTIAGTIRGLLRQWIEELLCDHLAIETMGPAFIWAFVTFALPFGYAEPAPSHPPNTLRLRLALDHLERGKWQEYMKGFAPTVMAWLRGIGDDADSIPLAQPFSFLHEQLKRHAVTIGDTAASRTAHAVLERTDVESEANEAAELIQHLILPVGLDTPLKPRSILLGGWQEAFRRHGDTPEGIVAALSDTRLQDLIGKAIELSVVSETWGTP
jgi:hypothetical protein